MPGAPPSSPARAIASGKTWARPSPTSTKPVRATARDDVVTAATTPTAASTVPPTSSRRSPTACSSPPPAWRPPPAGQRADGHGQGEAAVPGGGHGGRRGQLLAQQQGAPVGERPLAERGAACDGAEHHEDR